MITIRKWYLLAGLVLLVMEILIALYLHDPIVRPYIGDFLVVIMLYCFVRAFSTASYFAIAVAVLLFAYLIEFMQYLNILTRLHLTQSRFLNIVLGNYFEWIDMIAYTAGAIVVILFEKVKSRDLAAQSKATS